MKRKDLKKALELSTEAELDKVLEFADSLRTKKAKPLDRTKVEEQMPNFKDLERHILNLREAAGLSKAINKALHRCGDLFDRNLTGADEEYVDRLYNALEDAGKKLQRAAAPIFEG